jgi:hypothetical protein
MTAIWRRYMADVHAWEEYARARNDPELLAMVQLFKTNRISALCMAALMFAGTLVLLLLR